MARPLDFPARGSAGDSLSAAPPVSARRRMPQEVEHLVIELDQRVDQITQVESSRLRMMMDQVQKLSESLQSMRVQRELHEERRQQELRYLENHTQQDVAKSREDRRDYHVRLEERLDKFFLDRFEECRHTRSSSASTRKQEDSSCRDLSERLCCEVDRVGGILEEQRMAREAYGDRILSSLQAEFQKVSDAIHAERNLRHEAQHTMQRMVQDVCMRIRGEIQQERDTRETVQNRLLGLLEETCGRIEVGFGGAHMSQSLGMSLSTMRGARHALY